MRNNTLLLIACCLLVYLSACESASDNHVTSGLDSDSDTDTDSSTDSDADTDADTSSDSETETEADPDGGTWDGGNIFDEEVDCDCPDTPDDSPGSMTWALNVCPDLEALQAVSVYSSSSMGEIGRAIIDAQGDNDCILSQHGCQMVALSTGEVGQPDPDPGGPMGDDAIELAENDPMPQFQGDVENTAAVQDACDVNQLSLVLTAPEGAEGFSFDFLFASSEYPEWIGQGFNDTFYAIIEHAGTNGGAPTNISFDSNSNEIEVDTNFFENSVAPCDEGGSGWSPSADAGSTGWLRTSFPVSAGDTFGLTFSIHDEGDCFWDSIVFLDNFQWHGQPVENDTVIID